MIHTIVKPRVLLDQPDIVASLRCDACGEPVGDIAAHVAACLEHELQAFAVGRRWN